MHRGSTEIVETDRPKCKEETVPPDDVVDHPLDRYRIYNIVTGSLIFGYYYGFILSRFYIQDDIQSIKQEIIRTGVLGAVIGSAIGGWINDFLGRKFAILFANALIFVSGVLLSIGDCSSDCWLATVWKTYIGLGVGMASITSPIYILEVSSTHLQEHLHTRNCMLFAVGKFIFFCADTKVTSYIQELEKTSDYMIAVVGFPALLQFVIMLSLPDSPIWLYKRNRKEAAIKEALRKIYSSDEVVEKELGALSMSIKNETDCQDEKDSSVRSILLRIRTTWANPLERTKIVVSIGVQVAEQLMSENMIMYVLPCIMRMGGIFVSPNPKWDIWYMKFSLLTWCGLYGIHGSGLPYFTMKLRRRKTLLVKSYRMMVGLFVLSVIFIISPDNTEGVSKLETVTHFGDSACSSYISAPDADTWNCATCLRAGCGFCAGIDDKLMRAPGGACLTIEPNGTSASCLAEHRIWFTQDSVTRQCGISLPGAASIEFLLVCVVPYTFALESHMCSRMYKAEVRGKLVGTVAATNWIFFLAVIVSSYIINKVVGFPFSMLLISLISFSVTRLIKWSYLSVPEMKGSFQSEDSQSKVS
ncbi:probable inositol transporter 2 [Papaver somniferum]|uniref:probable inositol transporter 2 n=1 Tax=Papaver somniferum TaxID=3469 RepID=UPI000E6FE335|nr:probable inositol transporter 2 [Papaver somniferum]